MPLINYEAAIEALKRSIPLPSESEWLDLPYAHGRVLAEPLAAVSPNPAFDNSAVDGYLLGTPRASKGDCFQVIGEVRAGGDGLLSPEPGQAVRIFTGAPVPTGDFCIVMQEDVKARDGTITLNEGIGQHAGIRRAGSDFEEGVPLLPKGTTVRAPEIALAAWNGTPGLKVFGAPRVAVAVTGDELVPLGETLFYGQIHDSNGPMLEALCVEHRTVVVASRAIGDRREVVASGLAELAQSAQLVVVSGGASVGDYDHVPAAVAEIGEVIWHGVSVKPGKPTLFGKIGSSFIFGLPGNPSSAYVCFHLFVRPALRRISGDQEAGELWISARFDGSHDAANRDEFIRVRLEARSGENWAVPAFEQGSFGLRSLAAADALARLNLGQTYRPGDSVACLILPRP